MKKEVRWIVIVCSVAVAGVIGLQALWVNNYYHVNKDRFEKDANLAFEDAIKKEFKVRCDTLEGLIYQYLMDTSKMSITSKWSEKNNVWIYHVADKRNPSDKQSFSHKLINKPILSDEDTVKKLVARQFALTYREEDLERHMIMYNTQQIGKYVDEKAGLYSFDTNRLRPIYTQLLAERGIHQPFAFCLRNEDNTLNSSRLPDSLTQRYAIITKSFPTYKVEPNYNFVRGLFVSSAGYVSGKLTGILIVSGVLIIVVALAMYWLLRIIRREKKLSAIKNDFISNISHELKTPIATVAAAVDAMESFGVLNNPDKTKRYLTISKAELQRLSDMVSKILNLSLYERQEFELKPEPVNMDELVEEMTAKYTLASDKSIHFNYVNEAGVAILKADRLHLYNVINNLVDNAVKYSEEAVDIHIRFRKDKGHYVLEVKDNGIGISRADLPYIFDKFYRVPSGNIHKVKGYGLGLSYVKYIMEKHGGWCMAESHPGQGSTFKLGLQA